MRFFILFTAVLLISCSVKSSRFNKYVIDEKGNQKRNGMWIENSLSNNGELQEKGKYRNGEKVGLWKTSFEGKIYQKERFLKDYSKVKVYYPNGVLMQQGKTQTDVSEKERHWFYQGEWKFYDKNGKYIYSKFYDKGNKVDSAFVKNRRSSNIF